MSGVYVRTTGSKGYRYRGNAHSGYSGNVRVNEHTSGAHVRTKRVIGLLKLLVLSIAVVIAYIMVSPSIAQSSTPVQVEMHHVMPGDTLWSYAEQITPQGEDVSLAVQRLKHINHLDTSVLYPGQEILVPVK